jgi:carboxyl-terminal processing protease
MPRRNLIWSLLILAAAAAVLLYTRSRPSPDSAPVGRPAPLEQALRIIEENYLYPADSERLRSVALEAVAGRLDEYSRYLPPGSQERFDQQLAGRQWGLGLCFEAADGAATVLGPLPDSPAARAGLYSGDTILAIDSRPVSGLSAERIRRLLEPAPAEQIEPVRLELLREDADRPETLELRPASYEMECVRGLTRDRRNRWRYLLDAEGRVAYVRLSELSSQTPRELQTVLRRVDRPAGLVLDLRGNPGGYLPSAIEVADIFIDEGRIVTTRSRGGREEEHFAHPQDTYPPEVPIVVLIDGGTASGAELVAAALQHHGRAALVGTRSRGKGCVQSLFSLPGGLGQLNLTTAEFFVDPARPISRRGRRDRWGVQADWPAAVEADRQQRLRHLRRTAAVLQRPQKREPDDLEDQAAPGERLAAEILRIDRPLARAVELVERPPLYQQLLERSRRRRGVSSAAAATEEGHHGR